MNGLSTNLAGRGACRVRLIPCVTLVLMVACVCPAVEHRQVSNYRSLQTWAESGGQTQSQTAGAPAASQTGSRSPSDTVRQFYKGMREKRFRDAFSLSIYQPAVESLKPQEFEDLRPDFEKMAIAVNEKVPEKFEVTGEQISGNDATVFVRVLDNEGKEKVEPASLIKIDGAWILGDRESLALVKKAGKQFFFNARIDAHHSDVQDMLTRISLAQVIYSQQHNGQFADLPTLISAGLVPKDLESTESTGYRFRINVVSGGKLWNAAAEPAQYGRTGKLSFYLDPSGVKSSDTGGKPLTPRSE